MFIYHIYIYYINITCIYIYIYSIVNTQESSGDTSSHPMIQYNLYSHAKELVMPKALC